MKPSEIEIGQKVRVVIEGTVTGTEYGSVIVEDENSKYYFEPEIVQPIYTKGQRVIYKKSEWIVLGIDGDMCFICMGKRKVWVAHNEIKPVEAK